MLSVALENVAPAAPGVPLVADLVRLLLDARVDVEGRQAWVSTRSHWNVCRAHARAVTRCAARRPSPTIQRSSTLSAGPSSGWPGRARTTASPRSCASTGRPRAGRPGRPLHRRARHRAWSGGPKCVCPPGVGVRDALGLLPPGRGTVVWLHDGRLPVWMNHDAVVALRAAALAGFSVRTNLRRTPCTVHRCRPRSLEALPTPDMADLLVGLGLLVGERLRCTPGCAPSPTTPPRSRRSRTGTRTASPSSSCTAARTAGCGCTSGPAGTDPRGEWDPHSHRWDFASTVLAGDGLDIVHYQEAVMGAPHTRYVYDGRLIDDGQVLLAATGSSEVRRDKCYATQRGTSYILWTTPGVTTWSRRCSCRAGTSTTRPRCTGPTGVPDRPSRPISDAEVAQLIRQVLAVIKTGRCGTEMTVPIADPPATIRLDQMGERRIVRELIEPRYRTVPSFGDDCAVLGRDQVITTDSAARAGAAGMGMDDPAHTGWLLATINLSDLAAAGAEPEGLVAATAPLPPDTPVHTLKRIMDGVDACATEHGTRVLGGDIGEGRELRLSATAVGRCPRRLTAHGPAGGSAARRAAGDTWCSSGRRVPVGRGAAAHGFATLPTRTASRSTPGLRRGPSYARRVLAAKGVARAAIDVSDGLFARSAACARPTAWARTCARASTSTPCSTRCAAAPGWTVPARPDLGRLVPAGRGPPPRARPRPPAAARARSRCPRPGRPHLRHRPHPTGGRHHRAADLGRDRPGAVLQHLVAGRRRRRLGPRSHARARAADPAAAGGGARGRAG